ncbi:DUF6678 family protein [Rubinisphaera sp.]|uniref:DUF6678 family protein n=1 Tax=Rubinisphaera sp. TaxID=2024857 RepID=UPI00268F92AA
MADISPQPNFGTDEEKDRIRRVISERGLSGAANDVKWGRLIDAMRQRDGWHGTVVPMKPSRIDRRGISRSAKYFV